MTDTDLFYRMWHTAFMNNADRTVTIRGWLARLRGPGKTTQATNAANVTLLNSYNLDRRI